MTTTTSQIHLALEIHNPDTDNHDAGGYDASYMEDDYVTVTCYTQVKDIVNNWSCSHTHDDDECHIEYIHDTSGDTIYNYLGETEEIDNCPCVDCNN